MQYYRQDKKILEINEIKNIESISLKSLMDSKDKNKYIPVLIVTFDNGTKTLTYTSLDTEFNYFFEMVRRVYNNEKNTRKILIDEETSLFLKENYIDLDNILNEIGSCKTKNKKINYKIKENEMYFKMLKYILEDLLKFLNKNLEITDIKGINNTFSLIGTIDGLPSSFPFKTKKENNKRIFIFPGLINELEELIIEIKESDVISIDFFDRKNKLHGSHVYNINENKAHCISTLYNDGQCIFKKIEDLKKAQNQYKTVFNLMKINGSAYVLPWNDIRIVKKNIESVNEFKKEKEQIIDFKINKDNTHIQIINRLEESLSTSNYRQVKLDGLLKVTTLQEKSITNLYFVKGAENHLIRETSFEDFILGRGLYKSDLMGNHFYKVYKVFGSNLLDMTLDIKEYNINENTQGYQLLDEFELKLLLKRGGK